MPTTRSQSSLLATACRGWSRQAAVRHDHKLLQLLMERKTLAPVGGAFGFFAALPRTAAGWTRFWWRRLGRWIWRLCVLV